MHEDDAPEGDSEEEPEKLRIHPPKLRICPPKLRICPSSMRIHPLRRYDRAILFPLTRPTTAHSPRLVAAAGLSVCLRLFARLGYWGCGRPLQRRETSRRSSSTT
eukprot:1538780-Pyramimonas_sp.AAC.1